MLRALGALLFCIGLILIFFLKAQLFTGNNLMLTQLLTQKTNFQSVLKNWVAVYLGNLIGSLILSLTLYYFFDLNQKLSENIKSIAITKTQLSFLNAFLKATCCNILVCFAVWFAITQDRILYKLTGIIIPVTLFVYFAFEHSIANMFFIPLALVLLLSDLVKVS